MHRLCVRAPDILAFLTKFFNKYRHINHLLTTMNHKRSTGDLSPDVENRSPEHKRQETSPGMEEESAILAPAWFTMGMAAAMAPVHKKLDTLDGMRNDIESMVDTLNYFGDEVSEAKTNSVSALNKVKILEGRLSDAERVNGELKMHLKSTEDRMVSLECYSRRSNLNFDGIIESPKESPRDSERKVLRVIQDKLGIDVQYFQIERCHRYGKVTPGKSRPIKIRFNWYKDRETVWSKRTELKGTQIFMREDFPQVIENKRRLLRPYFKAARACGQYQRVFLRVDELVIDGRAYDADHMQNIPQPLKDLVATSNAPGATAAKPQSGGPPLASQILTATPPPLPPLRPRRQNNISGRLNAALSSTATASKQIARPEPNKAIPADPAITNETLVQDTVSHQSSEMDTSHDVLIQTPGIRITAATPNRSNDVAEESETTFPHIPADPASSDGSPDNSRRLNFSDKLMKFRRNDSISKTLTMFLPK